MENNETYEMYDTSDIEIQKPDKDVAKTQKIGLLYEVEINGKKFYTVDPIEFQKIENNLQMLKQRVTVAEQQIRRLQSQLQQRDQHIRAIKNELDTKVSHET